MAATDSALPLDRPPDAEAFTVAPGFEPVADAFLRLLAGSVRGGALTVRRGEEVLLDVWTGWADRRATRPWTPDTPALAFSTTKGLASTVIHRLADRGEIDYDEPVATWWPEFAAHGKGAITVRHLMSHRAGLHDVLGLVRRAPEMLEHELMESRLAAARPAGPVPGPPAYHAFTYGWLTAGLTRRVTGRSMAELVQRELAEPLETSGLCIGRPAAGLRRPAEVLGSSLAMFTTAGRIANPLSGRLGLTRAATRALLVPGFDRLVRGRDAPIWETQMPAVNGALTARGLATLYAALANGGAVGDRRLLSPETVEELGRVQTRAPDRVLGLPMRWRVGFHQAFGLGEMSSRAFGHYGYGGSGAWADPSTGLSLGYVNNYIGNLTTPIGDFGLWRLSALTRRCAREAR